MYTMVESVESAVLGFGFAEKESCYGSKGSENVGDRGTEEKSGGRALFRPDCPAVSIEGGLCWRK